MTKQLIGHPESFRKLSELLDRLPRADIDVLPAAGRPEALFGVPVTVSDIVPARDIQQKWLPPDDGRFTQYGPEDEAWMRPLGHGRLVDEDHGPVLFTLDFSSYSLDPEDTIRDPLPEPMVQAAKERLHRRLVHQMLHGDWPRN